MKVRLLILLGLLLAVDTALAADLRLAQPFQDHMVLQRQMPVPIWGWTDPDKTVTVKLGSESATATSDSTGYWCARLPAMEANATGQTVTISDGAKTITLHDVLIGEVWFCAGQSNMARTVGEEMTENPQAPKDDYLDADYPLVRFINYPNAVSDTPLTEMDPIIDGKAAWQVLGPDTAKDSMCMAFFFGRYLDKDLQVPVGLVQIAVSGTTQTAWAAKDVLDSIKADGQRSYSYDDCYAAAEKNLAGGKSYKSWAEFKTTYAAWQANPTGRPPISLDVMDYPGVLDNALVHPLAPMALRGMIWHQGEAGPFVQYGERMVAMVNDWRKLYGQNFWFLTGTMTRFTTKGPPLVPAAETLRSGINNAYPLEEKLFGPDGRGVMVGMFDLGNIGTHWQRKDEAGRRLALATMDHIYGKPSVYSGPVLIDSKIEGATVTCKFENVGTGLKYTPSINGISGFILVDKDNKVVWATPTIQGADTITVSDPAIPEPENLFYAYYSNPHETLFNSEGMPAYSFHLKDQPAPREKSTLELATAVPPMSDPKAMLNISDVHRYAYVVGFLNWHGVPGPNTIKCYIPKEWVKPAASQEGKAVPLGDPTPDEQGNRFVQVTAESNGPPVVLYDASQPDALTSVNTKRY